LLLHEDFIKKEKKKKKKRKKTHGRPHQACDKIISHT